MTHNCAVCASRDVTPSHLDRCAAVDKHRSEAVTLGTQYDVPAVTTADLWAHLGHIGSDADRTRTIRQVLDLGWRPVVGSDPSRLCQDVLDFGEGA